jgi:hypothetical protein
VDIELHQLELRHAELRVRDLDRRRRLCASIAELGQQVPVVVVASAERFVLIDGYLRVEVLRRLGRDAARATLWPIGEAEALIERHHLSAGCSTAVEQAWLLDHLHRTEGLSLGELALRFCRSKSWVSRRLGLVGELSATVQGRVRSGSIAPQAAMKYLVPLARANGRHCDRMVEALGETRVSVRQVAALCAGYRRADAEGRERLIAEPLLYLKAVGQAAAEAPTDEATALLKDLTALAAISWRAFGRLGHGALGAEAATYGRKRLSGAWRAAETGWAALRHAIEEAWPDARPGHADGDPATA